MPRTGRPGSVAELNALLTSADVSRSTQSGALLDTDDLMQRMLQKSLGKLNLGQPVSIKGCDTESLMAMRANLLRKANDAQAKLESISRSTLHIQAAWRECMVRRNAHAVRWRTDRQRCAATVIQACWRGARIRAWSREAHRVLRRHRAATYIQATFLGHRTRLWGLMGRRSNAANRIQAACHGFRARTWRDEIQLQRHGAAVVVQRIFLGYHTRCMISSDCMARQAHARHVAAVAIQS